MSFEASFITGQGVGRLNEDVLLLDSGQNVYGLFDGASSLVPYVSEDGETGGKIAADIACEAISQHADDLFGALKAANGKLFEAEVAADIDISQKESLWGTTASVVRVHDDYVDFVKIGNSPMLAVYEDGHHQMLGTDDDHDLETLKLWQSLVARGETDPWESLRTQNIKVRREVNETYGVLNGEEAAQQFIETGSLGLDGVRSIILLSDGLLIPKERPESDEKWDMFAKRYREGGLSGVLNYVRRLEKDDVGAGRYPRLKKHDDASAIALDFQ